MRGQKRKRKKMIKNETLIRSNAITANLRLLATHSAKPTINKNLKDEKPPEITEHYPSGC